MTTRLKTVHYAFTTLASLTNNTLTNLTALNIFIPETGTKTFRSVIASVSFDDNITATGGSVTTETIGLRLGAAAYTSISNANVLTNSAENISFWVAQDFTSHFQTNWTGTSMTCDFQLQVNQSTGTTLGMSNVCVTLEITYEYDDINTLQLKTVFIPINMPVSGLPTTATTADTLPILNTFLPEDSKVYRNMHVVVISKENRNVSATSHTMTLRIGTASVTTSSYTGALSTDRLYRYVWNVTAVYPSTAATQTWQPSVTTSRHNHSQAYLVVTYEFREDLSTRIMNSLMLPMDIESPMGGPTASDYQRSTRDIWIQEPGTIETNKIAFYSYWTQISAISGLNMRVGNGSFILYTDAAETVAGSNAAMTINDSAFTLVRGKNTLNFDVYNSETLDLGWNFSGFWIVNYTSDKSTNGSGSHNHTVFYNIVQQGTGGAVATIIASALSIQIPEADYFINAVGPRLVFQSTGVTPIIGMTIQVERLAAEGGFSWENGYKDIQQSDPEVGVFFSFAQMRTIFKRFPTDNLTNRLDLETSRRWQILTPLTASNAGSGWSSLTLMMTYHSISYLVNGTLSGGFSGTTTISLFRNNTGEKVKELTRSGDGSFSTTWYDNTIPMFVEAKDSTKSLISNVNLAGNVFNVSTPVSSGGNYYAG